MPSKLDQVLLGRIEVVFHHRCATGEAPSEGELLFKKVIPVRHYGSLHCAKHDAAGVEPGQKIERQQSCGASSSGDLSYL